MHTALILVGFFMHLFLSDVLPQCCCKIICGFMIGVRWMYLASRNIPCAIGNKVVLYCNNKILTSTLPPVLSSFCFVCCFWFCFVLFVPSSIEGMCSPRVPGALPRRSCVCVWGGGVCVCVCVCGWVGVLFSLPVLLVSHWLILYTPTRLL